MTSSDALVLGIGVAVGAGLFYIYSRYSRTRFQRPSRSLVATRAARRCTRPLSSGAAMRSLAELNDHVQPNIMMLAQQSSWPLYEVIPLAKGTTSSSGGAQSARRRAATWQRSSTYAETEDVRRLAALFDRRACRTS